MQLAVPLLPLVVKLFPPAFLRTMINFVPWPALHKLRDIVDLIDAKATELVRDRKVAIRSGKLDLNGGDDIMSLLGMSIRTRSPALGIHLHQRKAMHPQRMELV
jgi:hypothetical protein